MKHYSHEARTTLLELHNEFIHNILSDGNGKYRHSPLNDYGVHYHPDDDKFYDTAIAAFKELPYEVIKYYCSGWTGYLHGVETYDFLKEYASEFGIKLLSETEHDDLWKEDECEADALYHKSWEKVIAAITDALIDSWHSLCVTNGKRRKASKYN